MLKTFKVFLAIFTFSFENSAQVCSHFLIGSFVVLTHCFWILCISHRCILCQVYNWQRFSPTLRAPSSLNWLFPLVDRSFLVLWGPVCQWLSLIVKWIERLWFRKLSTPTSAGQHLCFLLVVSEIQVHTEVFDPFVGDFCAKPYGWDLRRFLNFFYLRLHFS